MDNVDTLHTSYLRQQKRQESLLKTIKVHMSKKDTERFQNVVQSVREITLLDGSEIRRQKEAAAASSSTDVVERASSGVRTSRAGLYGKRVFKRVSVRDNE